MALPTDAVLRYKLNERSGTSAASLGSNATAATLVRSAVNTVTSGPRSATRGQLFNGTSDFLTMPGVAASLGSAASFCCWIKLAVSPPVDQLKTGFANFGPVISGGANHATWTDGKLYLSFGRATGNAAVSRVDAITYGVTFPTEWHHIAVTTTPGANGWKLYIDGVLATETTGLTPYWDDDLWVLGKSFDGVTNRFFNGAVADFWLFDRAISVAEIEQIYLHGLDAELFHFKCNDTQNDSVGVVDSSGNETIATLGNMSPSNYATSGIEKPDLRAFDFSLGADSIGFDAEQHACSGFAGWFEIVDTMSQVWGLTLGAAGVNVALAVQTDGDFLLHWRSNNETVNKATLFSQYRVGDWFHLAVVADDDVGTEELQIYVDGEYLATIPREANERILIDHLCAVGDVDNGFLGKVDGLRGFNYPPTAQEIADLYALRDLGGGDDLTALVFPVVDNVTNPVVGSVCD